MRIRYLALAAGLFAHGAANAWFFILPIGAIQNAVQGAHCVPAGAKPGDKINVGGKYWTVVENNGSSNRCSQYPAFPNIAKMTPYLSDEDLRAPVQACLPPGAQAGQRTSIPILGEVEVQAITGDSCSDVRMPVSAMVVRVAGLVTPPATQPVSLSNTPLPPQYKTEPVPEPKSVADRLRELKKLRDENLITPEVYEAKQRDILSSQ